MSVANVFLIFKTHLDLGFTAGAHTVQRQYFEQFIPQALATAEVLRRREDGIRFVWTTGAWLIYEYLEQAPAAERRRMEEAIAHGDIAWHGLPFTFHSELVDEDLFRFGLSLAQQLDRRFGRSTIAAKMTDVPGHTRGIVPLLAEAGIRFLHIGVNEASTPPEVPPVFRWQDGDSDSEIMVMYQHTYGTTATLPGLDVALTFAHTNDNHGPQTPAQVMEVYEHLRADFPSAAVQAATLDDFARALEQLRESLPIVDSEIGDSWIHGVGTDPFKVSRYRELCRLRRRWLSDERSPAEQEALDGFSRILLCVPEHTWGMDEKTHLDDYTHYSRPQFEVLRQTERARRFAASWQEQRSYIDQAVDALTGTALAEEAQAHLAALMPVEVDTSDYTDVTASPQPFETAHFVLDFDRTSGAIIKFGTKAGREWADTGHPLAWLRYQTFNHNDYTRFMDQYLARRPDWAIPDFSKPGLDSAEGESRFWQPRCTAILHKQDPLADHFVLRFTGPAAAVERYGCPARFVLHIVLPSAEEAMFLYLRWFDKPANRQPEALWFSFVCSLDEPDEWRLHKLGTWIDPVDVVSKGNRHLHAIDEGVALIGDPGCLIQSLDAPLAAPGEPSLLDFHNRLPSPELGMHFNLYNNVWGTNFPMWYEDDARFRFVWRGQQGAATLGEK